MNQSHFTALAKSQYPALCRHAMHHGASEADAAEIANDALLALWQKSETLRDENSISAWLRTTTKNLTIDRHRKENAVRQPQLVSDVDVNEIPAETPEPRETPGEVIADALREFIEMAADMQAKPGERDAYFAKAVIAVRDAFGLPATARDEKHCACALVVDFLERKEIKASYSVVKKAYQKRHELSHLAA